jgi:hypothetical protein
MQRPSLQAFLFLFQCDNSNGAARRAVPAAPHGRTCSLGASGFAERSISIKVQPLAKG